MSGLYLWHISGTLGSIIPNTTNKVILRLVAARYALFGSLLINHNHFSTWQLPNYSIIWAESRATYLVAVFTRILGLLSILASVESISHSWLSKTRLWCTDNAFVLLLFHCLRTCTFLVSERIWLNLWMGLPI